MAAPSGYRWIAAGGLDVGIGPVLSIQRRPAAWTLQSPRPAHSRRRCVARHQNMQHRLAKPRLSGTGSGISLLRQRGRCARHECRKRAGSGHLVRRAQPCKVKVRVSQRRMSASSPIYLTLHNAPMAAVPSKADVYKDNRIFPVRDGFILIYIPVTYVTSCAAHVHVSITQSSGTSSCSVGGLA